jgi:hypothetical protein
MRGVVLMLLAVAVFLAPMFIWEPVWMAAYYVFIAFLYAVFAISMVLFVAFAAMAVFGTVYNPLWRKPKPSLTLDQERLLYIEYGRPYREANGQIIGDRAGEIGGPGVGADGGIS